MREANLYNVKNITTGELWKKVTAEDIAKRLNMSKTTVRKYAKKFGAIREYNIEVVRKEKRAVCSADLRKLLEEWDRYAPKINERIIKA